MIRGSKKSGSKESGNNIEININEIEGIEFHDPTTTQAVMILEASRLEAQRVKLTLIDPDEGKRSIEEGFVTITGEAGPKNKPYIQFVSGDECFPIFGPKVETIEILDKKNNPQLIQATQDSQAKVRIRLGDKRIIDGTITQGNASKSPRINIRVAK